MSESEHAVVSALGPHTAEAWAPQHDLQGL